MSSKLAIAWNPQVQAGDSTDREREFFSQLISATGEFNPFTDRGWRTLARRFQEAVAPRQGLQLLDLGCGTGQ